VSLKVSFFANDFVEFTDQNHLSISSMKSGICSEDIDNGR
jgi:hypothetical protein